MALIISDKVLENTVTVGAGSYTLQGAVSGNYVPASAVCVNGSTFYYHVEGVDSNGIPNGTGFEIGLGTWQAGNVLSRTAVHASSNGGAPVSWGSGTKRVALALTARFLSDLNTGSFASGTWPISISGNAATATTASTATTATVASKLSSSNWTIEEVSGVLYFKYGGVAKAKIESGGKISTLGDVAANQTSI